MRVARTDGLKVKNNTVSLISVRALDLLIPASTEDILELTDDLRTNMLDSSTEIDNLALSGDLTLTIVSSGQPDLVVTDTASQVATPWMAEMGARSSQTRLQFYYDSILWGGASYFLKQPANKNIWLYEIPIILESNQTLVGATIGATEADLDSDFSVELFDDMDKSVRPLGSIITLPAYDTYAIRTGLSIDMPSDTVYGLSVGNVTNSNDSSFDSLIVTLTLESA